MAVCYLCGEDGADTSEHVVPKCLYTGALPSDVLTLPAHRRCNVFTARHEEAFRNHISVAIPPESPGHGLWETTRRALDRPQAAGMQAEFYGSMLTTLDIDPDGRVRKLPVAARLKNERADWTLAKIVKGLFTSRTGELLPSAKTRWKFGQADNGRGEVHLPESFEVHRVMQVRWGRAIDEPLATMWILGFYETAWFWVSTTPTSRFLSNRAKGARAMIWPGPGR